jgi:hypothetical protein
MHFGDASHDTVVLFFLLHEMPADVRRKTIAEALRVTKPGGKDRFCGLPQTGRASSPFRYIMVPILTTLEPFAMDLWNGNITDWLPVECSTPTWTSKPTSAACTKRWSSPDKPGPLRGAPGRALHKIIRPLTLRYPAHLTLQLIPDFFQTWLQSRVGVNFSKTWTVHPCGPGNGCMSQVPMVSAKPVCCAWCVVWHPLSRGTFSGTTHPIHASTTLTGKTCVTWAT